MTTPPVDALFVAFQTALAGRYSLERELGRGGMGIVYLAREVRLDRSVAIKLLPPEFAAIPALRDRFLREARMAARLSQPNIIPIFAVDEIGGFVFYVMAYVDGETLARRVETHGPLAAPEAARILREVAWALAYAHAQGVIHRDVKPENILLERGSGRVLVADFGIARLAQASGGTGAGEVIGTPDFMSPEQASGEATDGRSDLYSLGVVGYYLLSGRLPFTAPNAAAVMAQHITQTPPGIHTVAAAIPRQLAVAVDRCLAKAPGDRFPTGEALAEAIGGAIEARRETPVPVRVFLKRLKIVLVVGVYAYMIALPPLIHRVWLQRSPALALATLLVLALPPAILGRYARELAALGFGAEDLALAHRLSHAREREEAQYEYGGAPTLFERVIGKLSLAGFAAAAVTAAIPGLAEVAFGAGAVAALSGLLWLLRRERRRISDSRLARLWSSPIGRAIFRIASLGLKRVAAAAGRPTELALGSAADALFDDLPKDARRSLAALPGTVRALEGHAQRIRARIDALDRAIGDARQAPRAGAAAEHRAALVADLHGAREAGQRRLGEVVAALETIRLDLLRLRAGAGSVDRLTADLTAAREIDDQTDRLLAGQREVEEALKGGGDS
ncbi:MAG TPA: serine/threonine-protein kinase [Gemmatimonadales bacterium]